MDTEFADQVRRDALALAELVPGGGSGLVTVVAERDDDPVARSAFDVDRMLASTATFAVGALGAMSGSLTTQTSIDVGHLLAWCTSTVLVDDEPTPVWADLSGVYETCDGRHLQLHCNFPHHADGVVRHLGVSPDRAALAAAISERDGAELEHELIDIGMIAALVRTLDEWDAHPHAIATRDLPIVTIERIDEAPPRQVARAGDVHVLDCTRVLAGPVAGHLLASAGCDVIRLGAEHLPSVDVGVLSTGFGKRNAFADLRDEAGRSAARELLAGTDVWIDGYRPGALAGHGLTVEEAAVRRPGVVVVQINAFDAQPDTDGPWAGRRGYDSIVQSTTGIRWAGGEYAVDDVGDRLDQSGPRGLPVQALDHATGFLAAGVAARLVEHQRRAGGSWLARLSLLRTRNRLVGFGGPRPYRPGAVDVPDEVLASVDAPAGRITAVAPFAGRWTGPPMPLGSSPATW
ncbi:MAG: CoA transferase [Actinomycetota bacterium]